MISRFLDYIAIERKYSQRTVEAYRDDLRDFCRFLGWEPEEFDPERVGEDDVKTWMLDLLEAQHQSPRSVKRKLSALRSFYKFLLRQGRVHIDVTARVTPPKADKPLPVFFRPAEMEAAEGLEPAIESPPKDGSDAFDSLRDILIIKVLYQTGMRQAELLGLEDGDWDLTQGQVRVFGKRRKERVVPVGERLTSDIRAYLAARAEAERDGLPSYPLSGPTRPFFVRRTAKGEFVPLTKNILYKIVRARMGEVTTRKKCSPHVLRHTFATAMLNNGADIRAIQELLGHASLNTTQVYTHTTFEQIKRVYMETHPRATQGGDGKNKKK